jgi:hypothetical protein
MIVYVIVVASAVTAAAIATTGVAIRVNDT